MFDNVNSFGVVYDIITRRTKAERRGTRWYILIQILQAVSWFDKNDRLPRQARDKQMYQERPPLEQVGVCPQEESLLVGGVILLFLVRKTPFWSHFYRAKTIEIYQDRRPGTKRTCLQEKLRTKGVCFLHQLCAAVYALLVRQQATANCIIIAQFPTEKSLRSIGKVQNLGDSSAIRSSRHLESVLALRKLSMMG
jgi:hypothetical protein